MQKSCNSLFCRRVRKCFPTLSGFRTSRIIGRKGESPNENYSKRVQYSLFTVLAKFLVQEPKLLNYYKQHIRNVFKAMVDWVLLLPEILDMHLKYIAHNVIKHKERCSFLHTAFRSIPLIIHVKDGRNDFVHPLYIPHFGVESCKDEQYSGQVVIAVSFLLLLPAHYA